jgi:oligoendopeptidase F
MTAAQQIPTRFEIPEQDTWDLTQIFKTEEEYRKSFSELRESYSKIAEFRGHLGESADTLLSCLEFDNQLEQISERLGHYSSLKKSEDSSDDINLSRRAELPNLLTKLLVHHSGNPSDSRRSISTLFRRPKTRGLEDLTLQASPIQTLHAFRT